VVRFAILQPKYWPMADALLLCPICKSKAKALDEIGDVLGFDCPNPKHGKFKVVDTIFYLPDLLNSDAKRWEAALKGAKARTQPGEWPTIHSFDFPSALYSS
jgi:hypothetical protein